MAKMLFEFSAHIGDEQLKAVHIIRFNAAGEFSDFEKMVRPMKAAKALGDAMGAKIGPQIKAMRAVGFEPNCRHRRENR